MKTESYAKLIISLMKIISITLILFLCVSLVQYAYADDAEADPEYDLGSISAVPVEYPNSSLLSTVTDENVIEYDNLLREVAYQTAVRSSGQYDYDAGDIYNLLWKTLVGNGNYYVKVYDNNTYNLYNSLITGGLISDILTSLRTIEGYNTYTDGIVQYTTASLLHAIASNITTNNSNLTNGLFDYNQNPYLGLIYNNLGTFETLFDSYSTNALNHLNTIDSKVNYIEQYTSYIAEAAEQSLVPNVAHIDSDLHNIKQWLNETFYYDNLVSSEDIYQPEYWWWSNHGSPTLLPVEYTSGFQWIIRNLSVDFPSSIGDKFDLIFTETYDIRRGSSDPAIRIMYFDKNNLTCSYPVNTWNDSSIIYSWEINGNTLIFHFDISEFKRLYPSEYYMFDFANSFAIPGDYNGSSNIKYETYIVSRGNYIEDINNTLLHMDNDLHLGYDILSTFKELYASDDLIAAKENQQQLEDSVLEDFTGSGSASASVSDAVDIKGVQSSIKGFLNTGDVSPSGLSTILDTSGYNNQSSFFYFWSSDCYNDINGINSIPQTRSVYYHLDDSDEYLRLVRSQSW